MTRSFNKFETSQRDDGATVAIWESECKDCEFLSGLAEVEVPGKVRFLLSGAGCYSRRDFQQAKKWALEVGRE